MALLLKRTLLRGATPLFVMEMPLYKRPALPTVLLRMSDATGAFLKRAGTFILASMVLVWALLYFPRDGVPEALRKQAVQERQEAEEASDATKKAEALEEANSLEAEAAKVESQGTPPTEFRCLPGTVRRDLKEKKDKYKEEREREGRKRIEGGQGND